MSYLQPGRGATHLGIVTNRCPSLFLRWLSSKYPLILQKVVEDQKIATADTARVLDEHGATLALPISNLYLDCNGIGKTQPATNRNAPVCPLVPCGANSFSLLLPRRYLFVVVASPIPYSLQCTRAAILRGNPSPNLKMVRALGARLTRMS